VDEEKRLKTVR